MVEIEKEYTNSYLIVFSPGTPILENILEKKESLDSEILLDGEWTVNLLPTLNNKWGDFRLPASNEYIGAEARVFRFMAENQAPKSWMEKDFKDEDWEEGIYGYGPQYETYSDSFPNWKTVSFSWQYGVWDNPGAQGYHGLKGKISDGFFILDRGGLQRFRTYVYVKESGTYRVEQIGTLADVVLIDGVFTHEKIELTQGWHSLLVEYANTCKINT